MDALIVLKSENKIIGAVPNIVRIEGNNVYGEDTTAEGIDLEEVKVIVVDSGIPVMYSNLRDDLVDHADKFIRKTADEIDKERDQRIADLELIVSTHVINKEVKKIE